MNQLSNILTEATERLPAAYFQVHVDGGDPVYRERVYCYELYHQMRCLWPATADYHLNGELDKAAHPILRDLGASHAKPDFLIHRPGDMTGNYAIMEVKACNAQSAGIAKDLQTLSLFLQKVGYSRAIYLLFGHDAASAMGRVLEVAKTRDNLGTIELWIHPEPGKPAKYGRDV